MSDKISFIKQCVRLLDSGSRRHQEEYIKQFYNKVDTLYVVCRFKDSEWGEVYSELKEGETYKVSHIGILRSSTHLMLEGFDREYFSTCFDFYENDKPCNIKHPRFWAPYLREMTNENLGFDDSFCEVFEEIEKNYNIKIINVYLDGSYAHGLNNDKSDYDLIFYYIALNGSDVKGQIEVATKEGDFVGLELKNALILMQSNQMGLLEISACTKNNNLLYKFTDVELDYKLQQFAIKVFDIQKAQNYYYRHLIMRNIKCLNNDSFTLKEFMYYLRGIMSCIWVETEQRIPPVRFDVYEKIIKEDNLESAIYQLRHKLWSGKECHFDEIQPELLTYCNEQVMRIKELVQDWQIISESELLPEANDLYSAVKQKYQSMK